MTVPGVDGAPAALDDRIGTRIGHYRVLGKLGVGGMGSVYLAEHLSLGRKAAIKILLPELSRRPDAIARFFNEARTLARLRHPALVDVYDFGTDESQDAYLVMELVDGEDLASVLRRVGRLPLAVAVDIAGQIAAALEVAHDHGVVHRDLKPENVLLIRPDADAGVRVKVLDFGVAKVLEGQEAEGSRTRTGSIVGTPRYMAPEQCRGNVAVDSRADVYALGCLLYAMTCGRPPFTSDSPGELIAAHIYETAPPPTVLEPSISQALEAVIIKALAKQVDDRFAGMAQFGQALEAAAPIPGNPVPALVLADRAGPVAVPQAATRAAATAAALARAAVTPAVRPRRRTPMVVAAAVLAALATTGIIAARRQAPVSTISPSPSRPQALSAPGGQTHMRMAMDVNATGHGLAVWAQADAKPGHVMVLARRLAPSAGWRAQERLYVAPGKLVDNFRAGIDDQQNGFAAWRIDTPDGPRLQTAHSVGTAWQVVPVTENPEASRNLRLVVGGAHQAAVMWTETSPSGSRAYVRVFGAPGGWGAPEPVDVGEPAMAVDPQLAMNAHGHLITLWAEGGVERRGLWARQREANGAWHPPVRISWADTRAKIAWQTIVCNRRGDAIVTWQESVDGASRGWASRFVAGRGFDQALPLSEPEKTGASPVPAIADNGHTTIIQHANEGAALVVRVWQRDHWSPALPVGGAERGKPIYPDVSIDDGGTVRAAWVQRDGDTDNVWVAVGDPAVGLSPRRIGTGHGRASVVEIKTSESGSSLVTWTQPASPTGPRLPWAIVL